MVDETMDAKRETRHPAPSHHPKLPRRARPGRQVPRPEGTLAILMSVASTPKIQFVPVANNTNTVLRHPHTSRHVGTTDQEVRTGREVCACSSGPCTEVLLNPGRVGSAQGKSHPPNIQALAKQCTKSRGGTCVASRKSSTQGSRKPQRRVIKRNRGGDAP